jgi:hypothetical protein
MLSEDELSNYSCELVKQDVNRIVVATPDQIFTILCKWNRKVTITCFRNPNAAGFQITYLKKSFRVRNNIINWKKLDEFLYKTEGKFMALDDTEEDFTILIMATMEMAEETSDEVAKKMLFDVIGRFPWGSKKVPQRVTLKFYAGVLTYILKNYKEEFLEYQKKQLDLE